jgi:hypothetical protein
MRRHSTSSSSKFKSNLHLLLANSSRGSKGNIISYRHQLSSAKVKVGPPQTLHAPKVLTFSNLASVYDASAVAPLCVQIHVIPSCIYDAAAFALRFLFSFFENENGRGKAINVDEYRKVFFFSSFPLCLPHSYMIPCIVINNSLSPQLFLHFFARRNPQREGDSTLYDDIAHRNSCFSPLIISIRRRVSSHL